MRHPQPSGQPLTFTPEQRRILPVLLIPAFVSLLAVSSVNVILPAIAASVPTSTGGLQLVVSGYSLVFGVLLVPAGRAGDVMGRGRLFVAGLVLFGLGSLAAGVAPSILALNLARVLMGMGSGLFNPQVTGLIQQYYAGAARGRAFGLFGGVIGGAPHVRRAHRGPGRPVGVALLLPRLRALRPGRCVGRLACPAAYRLGAP